MNIEIVTFGEDRPWPARELAALHMEYLPQSLSCRLGMPFLEGFYYSALPEAGLMFGVGAYVDGRLGAMTVGTFDADGFMREGARRKPAPLARALLLSLLQNPSRIRTLATTARLMRTRSGLARHEPAVESLTKVVRREFTSPEFKSAYGSLSSAVSLQGYCLLLRRNIFSYRAMVERDNVRMRERNVLMGNTLKRESVAGFEIPMVEYEVEFLKHHAMKKFLRGEPPVPGMRLPADLAHFANPPAS